MLTSHAATMLFCINVLFIPPLPPWGRAQGAGPGAAQVHRNAKGQVTKEAPPLGGKEEL